jgi:nucleoside-diphosphate-sugar epimerase
LKVEIKKVTIPHDHMNASDNEYILCSTVDVYTKLAKHYPIRENEERNPASSFPYAFYKAACEEILLEAHNRDELTVTIICPAEIYGEGGDQSALLTAELTIWTGYARAC